MINNNAPNVNIGTGNSNSAYGLPNIQQSSMNNFFMGKAEDLGLPKIDLEFNNVMPDDSTFSRYS